MKCVTIKNQYRKLIDPYRIRFEKRTIMVTFSFLKMLTELDIFPYQHCISKAWLILSLLCLFMLKHITCLSPCMPPYQLRGRMEINPSHKCPRHRLTSLWSLSHHTFLITVRIWASESSAFLHQQGCCSLQFNRIYSMCVIYIPVYNIYFGKAMLHSVF